MSSNVGSEGSREVNVEVLQILVGSSTSTVGGGGRGGLTWATSLGSRGLGWTSLGCDLRLDRRAESVVIARLRLNRRPSGIGKSRSWSTHGRKARHRGRAAKTWFGLDLHGEELVVVNLEIEVGPRWLSQLISFARRRNLQRSKE